LNGYANIEIPRLTHIQDILVYLGVCPSQIIDRNKNLSLTEVSMCLGYLIDMEQEIYSFRSLKEFVTNINLIALHLVNYGSPVLIGSYTCYSIMGIDFEPNLSLLIIYHNYSGSDSLMGVNKFCKMLLI